MLSSLLGGALIGVAASLLLLLNGRIAGVSGILGGLLRSELPEWRWRALFVAGLLVVGLAANAASPGAIGAITTPLPVLAIAGLLVGFGTSLGSGCTSGHGVCGISRGSPRSIAATMTFVAVASAVVFAARHVGTR
jgi:uncharacterized membrane protein YedE/YeeE